MSFFGALEGVQLVAEVKCPHKVGLCYFTPEYVIVGKPGAAPGQTMPATLSNLPCPCNDKSEILRLFAEIASPAYELVHPEETKP